MIVGVAGDGVVVAHPARITPVSTMAASAWMIFDMSWTSIQ
jgi:hypothetical protein